MKRTVHYDQYREDKVSIFKLLVSLFANIFHDEVEVIGILKILSCALYPITHL